MTPINLDVETTADLVRQFRDMALAQDKAQMADDLDLYNQLFRKMALIGRELKSRPGDQRRALLPLCCEPNAHVRYMAAAQTLALEPDLARQCLEQVRKARIMFASLRAGMTILALDDGTFKPS